jgi:hypothetical protein
MARHWEDWGITFHGRLSPFAKEMIYRNYQKGATIKDMSLRFGVLPQRIKAIIWQKHMYWEEVYPKLGEMHLRAALETEAMYAAEFPFQDYGSDLTVMAEMEKGVKLQRLCVTETDAKPDHKEQEQVDGYMARLPKRRYDKVPVNFYGKGPNGYLLYDLVHHKSKGSAQVTQ